MKNSTVEKVNKLLVMSEEQVMNFIGKRLKFDENVLSSMRHMKPENEHKRFNMSGYEKETGACTVWNMGIVNLFADLGIYNFTEYLFLDFYKGTGTLYLQYFGDNTPESFEFSGIGTREIIYNIFLLTIFKYPKGRGRGRRRN